MNKLEFHKHVFLRILFVLSVGVVTFNPIKFHSQEIPILTQFTSQDFIINPAFTGDPFFNETPIYITGREQWMGFTGGNPRTISVGGHGLIKKVGIGARIYRDEQGGAFSKDEFDFNIAVPIRFSKNSFLRFGLGGAFKSLRTDSNFENVDPSDPLLLPQSNIKTFKPSFGLGLSFKKEFDKVRNITNIGFSFININTETFLNPTLTNNARENYLYINSSFYKENIKKFEFNILQKSFALIPKQLDVMLLKSIKDKFKLGGFLRMTFNNYQNLDAFGPIVNFDISNSITLGYSTDFTGSGLRSHSAGTHEIVLRIIPNSIKNYNDQTTSYLQELIEKKDKKEKKDNLNKGSSKKLGITSIEIKTGDDVSDLYPVTDGQIKYTDEEPTRIYLKGSMIDGSIKGFRVKLNSSNDKNYCFDLIPLEIVNGVQKEKDFKEIEKADFPTDINDTRLDKNGYLKIQPKTINDQEMEFVNNRYKLKIYDCNNQSLMLEIILKIKR